MKTRTSIVLGLVAVALASLAGGCATSHQAESTGSPLQRLLEGNERFVSGDMKSHDHDDARASTSAKQYPFAIIVSCSDSRVPPEVVFDQGVGDVFVIRTAGQVVDDIGLGSIEYAVEHLHTKFILVLGHERCGAVAAALGGGKFEPHIDSVVKAIQPAVAASKNEPGDALENAVRAQVREVVRQLRGSAPVLAKAVLAGEVTIVGARYDMNSGAVEMIEAK